MFYKTRWSQESILVWDLAAAESLQKEVVYGNDILDEDDKYGI